MFWDYRQEFQNYGHETAWTPFDHVNAEWAYVPPRLGRTKTTVCRYYLGARGLFAGTNRN